MKILNSYTFNIEKNKKIFLCYINERGENSFKIIEPKLSVKMFELNKFDEYKYIIEDPDELYYLVGSDRVIGLIEYCLRNKRYIKLKDDEIKIYKKINNRIININPNDFVNELQYSNKEYKIFNKFYYFSYFDKMFKNMKSIDFDDLNICYFDIEVVSNGTFPTPDEAKFPVTLISLFFNKKDEYYVDVIVNNEKLEYKNDKALEDKIFDDVKRILCTNNISLNIYNEMNEINVIKRFTNLCRKANVISGWNSVSFDFKYLYNRAKKLNVNEFINFFYPLNTHIHTIEKDLLKSKEDSFWKNNEIDTFEFVVLRIPNIDYNTLVKTSLVNRSFSSYKLGFIAEKILGEGISKIDIDLINWEKDIDLFVKYNIMDTILVCCIEKKMNLLRFLFDLRKIVGYFPLNKISSNIILQTYIFNIIKNSTDKKYSILTNRKDDVNNKLFKIYKKVNNYE